MLRAFRAELRFGLGALGLKVWELRLEFGLAGRRLKAGSPWLKAWNRETSLAARGV